MKMGNGSLLVMDIRREKTDTKCILITNSEQAVIECEGIEIDVVPAWKWLLEELKHCLCHTEVVQYNNCI